MAKIDYTVLSGVPDNIESLRTRLSGIIDSCASYPTSVDSRLQEYYKGYFSSIESCCADIEMSDMGVNFFKDWFDGTIVAAQAVDTTNRAGVGNLGNGGSGSGSTGSEGVNPVGTVGSGATGAGVDSTSGDGTSAAGGTGTGATGASVESTNGDGTSAVGGIGTGAIAASVESTNGDGTNAAGGAGAGATSASVDSTNGDGTKAAGEAGTGAASVSVDSTNGDGTSATGEAGTGATAASVDSTNGDGTSTTGEAGAGASTVTVGFINGSGPSSIGGAGDGATNATVGLIGGTVVGAMGNEQLEGANAGVINVKRDGVSSSEQNGDIASQILLETISGIDDDTSLENSPIDVVVLSSLAGGGNKSLLNSSEANNLEYYNVSSEEWNRLSFSEQEAIKANLKKLGFTNKEIEEIINGKRRIIGCVQDAIAVKLEKLLENNPDLRQKLIDIYGIDVFNPNGTIDKLKLTLMMIIDDNSSTDMYSLINLLHDVYGVDLVSNDIITKVTNELLNSMRKSSLITKMLLKKYGFDIFNKDGTVNYENLIKALLMDNVKSNDKYNIEQLLEEFNNTNELLLLLKSYFGGGILSVIASTALIGGTAFLGSRIVKNYGKPIIKNIFNNNTDDNNGYYVITKYRLSSLKKEMSIFEKKLFDVFYNFDEINDFKEGKYAVLAKLLDELQSTLELVIVNHKDIKQKIYQVYGFDVYDNEKVNKTKLAIIMLIDFKNIDDRFNLIKLLSDNYDINVIVKEEYNKIIEVLKDNIKSNKTTANLLNKIYNDNIVNNNLELNEEKFKGILAKEYNNI